MLTLIERIDSKRSRYRCECGIVKVIQTYNVKCGKTRSCGCYRSAVTTQRFKKHGHSMGGKVSRAYDAWRNMKGRCTRPTVSGYENYGGRGISYDPRWESFAAFLEDMGEPAIAMTLDRLDNDGNYCKANCAWRSMVEQCSNRRGGVRYEFNGRRLTLAQWAKITGLEYQTLWNRLKRGVSIERALTVRGHSRA